MKSKHLKELGDMTKQQRWKERKRLEKRCTNCGNPIDSERSVSMCSACLDKAHEREKRVVKTRAQNGECRYCGRKVNDGYKSHNRNECNPSRRVAI
jgi:ribonuclease HI